MPSPKSIRVLKHPRKKLRKVTSNTRIKGYVHHASKNEPQYIINSDKTDHVAIHKGPALNLVSDRKRKRSTQVRRQQ
jgi:hypothetical protein